MSKQKYDEIYDRYFREEIEGAIEWCYHLYVQDFKDTFDKVKELQEYIDPNNASTSKISDSDLEWIITALPLELFGASESLNNMKLGEQVIKLKRSEIKLELENELYADEAICELTKSEQSKTVGERVAATLAELDIVKAVHQSTIARVENQITFCKELIMGAKKVWDSRRSAESVNPISEVVEEDLPEYKINNIGNKQRIY